MKKLSTRNTWLIILSVIQVVAIAAKVTGELSLSWWWIFTPTLIVPVTIVGFWIIFFGLLFWETVVKKRNPF
jgi:hypothetical protein